MYSIEDKNRFFSKVDKTDTCWVWKASIRGNSGYGAFKINGKVKSAHRVSWEIYNEKKIPDGLLVCHKCNNRLCVNPEHLYVGTYVDNTRDAIRDGVRDHYKYVYGKKVGTAKLSEDNILEVVRLYEKGLSHKEIAKKLKVDRSTIGDVLRGRTWKHIDRKIFKHYSKKKSKCPKLLEEEVLSIRDLAKKGVSTRQLANKFNVSYSTIYDIIHYRTWKNI